MLKKKKRRSIFLLIFFLATQSVSLCQMWKIHTLWRVCGNVQEMWRKVFVLVGAKVIGGICGARRHPHIISGRTNRCSEAQGSCGSAKVSSRRTLEVLTANRNVTFKEMLVES